MAALRRFCYRWHAIPSSRSIASSSLDFLKIRHDATYVNLIQAPAAFDKSSAVVYPNFITHEEGKSFIKEASKRMKRRKFEEGHWDAVIVRYREVELLIDDDVPNDAPKDSNDTPPFVNAIRRTRQYLAAKHLPTGVSDSIKWIPCHAIDLSADGRLDAHVDSVKFSGDIVAGISLLSDAIMRLKPCSDEWKIKIDDGKTTSPNQLKDSGHVDLYLPKQSLYVLSGMSRFSYTHELLPCGSSFDFIDADDSQIVRETINVERGRRLSIIFRDELRSKVTTN